MQITSGYGIRSRDSSPRLRRKQAVTGLGRGILARGYVDVMLLQVLLSGRIFACTHIILRPGMVSVHNVDGSLIWYTFLDKK
jgi:hypothetical protein